MSVLLFESDKAQAQAILRALEINDLKVDLVRNQDDALGRACANGYGTLVIGFTMAHLVALVRRFRETGFSAPIVAVSTFGSVDDRLATLEAGADDCFDRTSDLRELAAKVRVLLRRPEAPQTLQVADLKLDRLTRTVTRQGKAIPLTVREYALLEYLMLNAGRTLTRGMVMENVWNTPFRGLTNVVDVHIRCLRMKIDQEFPTKLIRTDRGLGYSLVDPEVKDPQQQAA